MNRANFDNCDLCGNTAFREGYAEVKAPVPRIDAFDPPPSFPGYLKPTRGADSEEDLVRAIVDQVLAALR